MSEYVGHENLETAQIGVNYNDWVYQQFRPILKGNILEVGSGLGTFSAKIIDDFPNSAVSLTEMSPTYIDNLKKKFANKDNVSVYKLDLNKKEDYDLIGYEQFDSIIAINVLEHVEEDMFAIQQIYKMLKKNGTFGILVPAHKFLYTVIDSDIGHFRRYTKEELLAKIRATNFNMIRMYYFNVLGMVGWYYTGKIRKNKQVNPTALKVYDKLLPLSKLLDSILRKKTGISIICHLMK